MVQGLCSNRAMGIRLVRGDITTVVADALVTAANAALAGGGGVDGAIHRAAGPQLLDACGQLGGCATGGAVTTPAFELEARGIRRVVHAVGPIWHGGGQGEPKKLASAYRRSLEVAAADGCRSIAFPSISTGVYGYPVELAARIAVEGARDWLAGDGVGLEDITFVLFDEPTHAVFVTALG